MNIKDQIAAKAANTTEQKLAMYLLPSINCKVISPNGAVLLSTDGIVEVDIVGQPELYEEMENMVAIGNCSHYSQHAKLSAAQTVPAESI